MDSSEQVISAEVRGPGKTFHLDDSIASTFWSALMLTADSECAGDVVLDSINALAAEDLTTECLLNCVLNLSLTSQRQRATAVATDSIVMAIPAELRRVLDLTTNSRHCFVLRVLLKLPLRECARLLQRSEDCIAELTCRAASELATLRANEL